MFFGIGALPVFMIGLPVVIGLFFIFCSEPDNYVKHYSNRYEKNRREWEEWENGGLNRQEVEWQTDNFIQLN